MRMILDFSIVTWDAKKMEKYLKLPGEITSKSGFSTH